MEHMLYTTDTLQHKQHQHQRKDHNYQPNAI